MAAEFQIEAFAQTHFSGVKSLWEDCFPDDAPRNRAEVAIPAKLEVQPELFFVAIADGEVIGTTMAGYDGHRGWLYAVAVDSQWRRTQVGTSLVRHAERELARKGCGKVNLQVRSENQGVAKFYHTLGYAIEDRISMGRQV